MDIHFWVSLKFDHMLKNNIFLKKEKKYVCMTYFEPLTKQRNEISTTY
jgi:hypothetical protein